LHLAVVPLDERNGDKDRPHDVRRDVRGIHLEGVPIRRNVRQE
jgi:hypothetical protein